MIIKSIQKWFFNRRAKRLDKALGFAIERANILRKAKGRAVVCSYCGKLMPIWEAGVIYDIKENRLTYHHDECFYANEHVSDKMPEEFK